MRERGIEPEVITYNAAMTACGKASQWERALELLSEMRERGLEPDMITYSVAISACEKGSQKERALELLSEMRERGLEPNIATYTAVMQVLVAAGNIDESFVLLQEVEAAGLAADPEAYTMHRSLLVACQFAGDADRVKLVKVLMELHGVSRGTRAVASAVIDGRLSEFSNDMSDSQRDAALLEFCTDVSLSSPYEVQFSALPIGFLESSTKAQQKKSLRHHAEKKALAEILRRGCDSLEIGVNFHMCIDCHEFFKGASQSLGRRIEVREPSVLHRFSEGACSCNDQWRWEARFVVP
jgi:pentatricopeptide repeat protein